MLLLLFVAVYKKSFSYSFVIVNNKFYPLQKLVFDIVIVNNYNTSQKVVNELNSLPSDVVSPPTILSFKQKLDEFWEVTGHGYEQWPGA